MYVHTQANSQNRHHRNAALGVLGNKFLYPCVKEVCRLCTQPRFDTFNQFLVTVEAL
jgi:hypothetical protein